MNAPSTDGARTRGGVRPSTTFSIRLRTAAVAAGMVLLAACASRQLEVSSGSNNGNMVAELNTAGSSFDFRASTAGAAKSDTIAMSPEKLWPYLGKVYDALSIPVHQRNETAHVLGSVDFEVARHLGDNRLSLFLDCGSTITGSMADQGQLMMTVATQVRPATESGDQSEVATLVTGTARQHGLSSTETNCTSTGRLEQMIATRLKLMALGQKGS